MTDRVGTATLERSLPLAVLPLLPVTRSIMNSGRSQDATPKVGTAELPGREESHDQQLAPIARLVTVAACVSIALVAGATLFGWAASDRWLIRFPTAPQYGTMMPFTAVGLLLSAGALWLLRREDQVSRTRRNLAMAMITVPVLLAALFLWEYAFDRDLGIDRLLFREALSLHVDWHAGRSSLATSLCFLTSGLALFWLDATTMRRRRASEILTLVVVLIALERAVSYLFGEATLHTPNWLIFGVPLLAPMAPKTAGCFLALALGIMYARPANGLVSLFLAEGPGGIMARRLLPLAIVLPIAFGWLGLISVRTGFRGTAYPLSLVVMGMIVLLLLVISLNARTVQNLHMGRSRALAALGERERLLRAVFDNAGAGLALVDVQGRPVVTNKALRTMLGYSESELATMTFPEFTHPDDVETDKALFREVLLGERDSYRMEKRYVRKDGGVFWGALNTSMARDPEGRPEFMVGMVEDVTQRREAEEAQQRLTDILEVTPDFVGISDANAKVMYVNRAGRRLTGAPEDLAGLSVPDFHPVETARRVVQEALPITARDGVWSGESELLGAGGKHVPVSQVILAHRGPAGEVAYFSTIMRDITERKQLEDAQRFLLQASRLLAGSLERNAILRGIAELIVPERADQCTLHVLGPDGSVERSVVARADGNGRPTSALLRIHPHGKEPNPIIAEVLRTGKSLMVPSVTDEWRTRMAGNGQHPKLVQRLRPRSFMAVPMRGRDRVLGVICFALVRSDARYSDYDLALARELAVRAALALDNARLFREARDAVRVRDQVLRVVAHDLRNPLNTISLSTGLLQEQCERLKEPEWRDALDIISRSVAQADRLIRDLLDIARMEVGTLALEQRPVDSAALLSEVLALHEPMAAQRGIELRAAVPPELPWIQADRDRLMQVFSNLIGNAVKFGLENSVVEIRAVALDGEVRFSVQDRGSGIAETDMPHLFDPFWQAHKGAGGAGLGLPICKGIVEAHGGRIWAVSQPEVGSTFSFTVPMAGTQRQDEAKAAD